jgi:uncharacterized protein (TIGR02145 family)/uncharacterized repeat protein (TIGR02543 family)
MDLFTRYGTAILPAAAIVALWLPAYGDDKPVSRMFTDARDGQKYRVTAIGGQTWMAQNLNYEASDGSQCHDNKKSNCAQYGRLYDWETAMEACPFGWHLPADSEWDELVGWVAFAGGARAGDKLKAKTGWRTIEGDDYKHGTDDFGFSALPAGSGFYGTSRNPVSNGYWWTATAEKQYGFKAYLRKIKSQGNFDLGYRVDTETAAKDKKMSVRCVMDENRSAAYSLTLKAATGGTVARFPNKMSYNAGKTVTISAYPNRGYVFVNWTGGKTANDTAATSTVAMNANMTITANFRRADTLPDGEGIFVDKRDGNIYTTVKIGIQTWMAENLNLNIADGAGSWCYGNSLDSCAKYGRLYDWPTAMAGKAGSKKEPSGVRGVCPEGWHLPSQGEWAELDKYVDDGKYFPGAASKLKSKHGWTGYKDENGNGGDDYGFSALPGGRRNADEGFNSAGNFGHWWMATVTEYGNEFPCNLTMGSGGRISVANNRKTTAFSVRCVMDKNGYITPPNAYAQTLEAGAGGTVSGKPGEASRNAGENDAAAPPRDAYGTLADARDGKSYKTVKIGGQTWTAENLNYETDNSTCHYNTPDKCQKYGRLYGLDAARTACPPGWHLPSNQEWEILVEYAGGKESAGKNLKSTSGWTRNGNGADVYGFSALPGSRGYWANDFDNAGNAGYWWTATANVDDYGSRYANAWEIYYFGDKIKVTEESGRWLSVRCVLGEDSSAAPVAYSLKLNAGFGGTVSANPRKASYGPGEKVTITASPGDGYIFTHWRGGQVANAASAATVVAVNSNMTIAAHFRRVGGVPAQKAKFPMFKDALTRMEMVFVAGGTFTTGCAEEEKDCGDDDRPTRSVTVGDFYIGKHEVTQKQWRQVMGSLPLNLIYPSSRYVKGDNYPVYHVSWNDAKVFIQALNRKTGNTYRLPTEAEWEYAAGGGAKSKGYKYSGSDNIEDVAWYNVNRTRMVGAKRPNELGLYDMSGNVWEWVNDSYAISHRVLRGGGWYNDEAACRVSGRDHANHSDNSSPLGFRLALSPP